MHLGQALGAVGLEQDRQHLVAAQVDVRRGVIDHQIGVGDRGQRGQRLAGGVVGARRILGLLALLARLLGLLLLGLAGGVGVGDQRGQPVAGLGGVGGQPLGRRARAGRQRRHRGHQERLAGDDAVDLHPAGEAQDRGEAARRVLDHRDDLGEHADLDQIARRDVAQVRIALRDDHQLVVVTRRRLDGADRRLATDLERGHAPRQVHLGAERENRKLAVGGSCAGHGSSRASAHLSPS
jgi:hypothetical protein